MAGQLLASEATAKAGPNDTVGIGIVGVGNRGTVLLQNLLQIPGVVIRAICDIDAKNLERGLKAVEDTGQKRPAGTTDALERATRKDGLDAIVSAIPCDLHAAVIST